MGTVGGTTIETSVQVVASERPMKALPTKRAAFN
jgi:hypothetical protein